jgi:hypothetical protein
MAGTKPAMTVDRSQPTTAGMIRHFGCGLIQSFGSMIKVCPAPAVRPQIRCVPVRRGLSAPSLMHRNCGSPVAACRSWSEAIPSHAEGGLGAESNLIDQSDRSHGFQRDLGANAASAAGKLDKVPYRTPREPPLLKLASVLLKGEKSANE